MVQEQAGMPDEPEQSGKLSLHCGSAFALPILLIGLVIWSKQKQT